jgi:AmmeMemoRadiSam system protein B
MATKVRIATHAGSWYTDDDEELDGQLTQWLHDANPYPRPAKAIIAPHAGYSYCGRTGGWAYKAINPTNIKRVFVLGPSHHASLGGCALSSMTHYETPLGNLTLDAAVIKELADTGSFEFMSKKVDEDEHSLEMHLPYIAKVMQGHNFQLVPILVGALSTSSEAFYGNLLSKYLLDPVNLFVISSDFCHWGKRFSYTLYDQTQGAVYNSIEHLDRTGMSTIQTKDPAAFTAYLKKTKNTICGRHPIAVLLNMVQASKVPNFDLSFVHYSQSSQAKTMSDSSVSYAAGILSLT